MGISHYVFIVFIAMALIFGFKNVGDENWINNPIDASDESAMIFDITTGESGKTIAKNLKTEGLIDSNRNFYSYLKDNDLGNQLQAGRFVLNKGMSPLEIIEALTSGAGQVAITIPEGFTLEQIDDRIANIGLAPDNQFANCMLTCSLSVKWNFLAPASSLEGYLFPDTFFVDPASFTSEGFAHRLLGNFETKVLTPENELPIAASGRTLDEIIIMASIVEREAFLDEDYPVIAGILWKRLDNGWALEADATLLYVLDDADDLVKNLNLDSPYNTRLVRGLPPTAISNPGLTAIQAAIYPEDSSYWFYLNDQDTGKAHFAETNEQHNVNKAKWLY
jgi:UPF0755 protein